MSEVQTIVAAVAAAYTLQDSVITQCRVAGTSLARGDMSFEKMMEETATSVAAIMGTEPTYDHWVAVSGEFQNGYVSERKCKPETAAARWLKVAAEMVEQFALEKPAKPTKAAEVKAAQRKGAALEADTLIASAKATTPAEVLKLAQAGKDGAAPKAPVIAALAKIAGDMGKAAAKEANDAAREESKKLRDDIRKGVQDLNLSDLRKVAKLVASMHASTDEADDDTETETEDSSESVEN